MTLSASAITGLDTSAAPRVMLILVLGADESEERFTGFAMKEAVCRGAGGSGESALSEGVVAVSSSGLSVADSTAACGSDVEGFEFGAVLFMGSSGWIDGSPRAGGGFVVRVGRGAGTV
jgi:hypothetical protein